MDEKRERISMVMAIMLVAVAFSVDLFEMLLEWLGIGILGLSSLISICATVLFFIWFKILDVAYIASPKKFFTFAATCLAEIVPGLDAIGGFLWTAGTILMVLMVRAEDKGGIVGQLSGTAMSMVKARYQTYGKSFNKMGNLNPEQQRDLRQKVTISREQFLSESQEKNPKYNRNQLNRALDMTNEKVNPNTLDLKNYVNPSGSSNNIDKRV